MRSGWPRPSSASCGACPHDRPMIGGDLQGRTGVKRRTLLGRAASAASLVPVSCDIGVLRPVALILGLLGLAPAAFAYSHVVVVILENRDYAEIIGDKAAPYINAVLTRHGTVLTNSIALSRPSQPNYLQLFSGSPQTVPRSNGPV